MTPATVTASLNRIVALLAIITIASGNFLGLREKNDYEDDSLPFSTTHLCDYFEDKPNLKDGPCYYENQLDANGACNTTQICRDDSHCYISWKNESGVVTIVKSGCWLRSTECPDKPECIAKNDTLAVAAGKVFYCCCNGDFCNRNFYLDPTFEKVEDIDEEPPVEAKGPDTLIAVKILAPLFVVCFLVVLGYFCYRKRKMQYDDMDRMSVDTPATGATRVTTASNPFPQEPLQTPQFLDVKARGRFGKVWRAQLHDEIVAVKTFNLSEKASWQNEQDIFLTPLMNMHDNILKFRAVSSGGEGMSAELWLVTDFYERGSLADYLRVHTVNLNEALRIIRTMASGMSFLHEDIISPTHDNKPAIAHRDFKSKNVLLDHNLNAVIADFGLAVKFMPGESPGESHGQVGTLRYMAPEVLEGAINFQKDSFLRIDMYAFGLVTWEILSRCTETGSCDNFRMPFEAELGATPSIDIMQEYVVEKKLRPLIKEEWRRDKEMSIICETMEECWDHDAEARLSAGCVELRIAGIQRQRALTNDPSPLIVNMQSSPPISQHGNFTNTEAMNLRNLQMNVLNAENNRNSTQQPNKTSSLNDGDQNQEGQNKMTEDETLVNVSQDDDHDSGTFANEDTLSHDGVMEQLISENQETTPEVVVVDDSATSLLSEDERESNL